jgi:hypothetical protein
LISASRSPIDSANAVSPSDMVFTGSRGSTRVFGIGCKGSSERPVGAVVLPRPVFGITLTGSYLNQSENCGLYVQDCRRIER